MADPTGRIVAHALFTYTVNGRQRVALRGTEVHLSPADLARAEAADALVPADAADPEPAKAGTLPDWPAEGTDEEKIGWVQSGTVAEIVAKVQADPAIANAVLDAETAARPDKGPRASLVAGIKAAAGTAGT